MTPEPAGSRIAWLASYPKSGNTWFRAVTVAWRSGRSTVDLNKLRAPGIASIASARPRIERALGIPTSLMTAEEIDLLRPRVDDVLTGRWGVFPGDGDDDDDAHEEARVTTEVPEGTRIRLTKIHDALGTGPTGELIVSSSATIGALYVVRDPRDVAVSYADHYGLTHEQAVTVLGDPGLAYETNRHHLSPQVRQRLGTWSQHVESWLDQSWFPVHVVRYEDCHRDPVATFTTALRFAGFDARPDDVAEAVEAVRFERLVELEATTGFRERSQHSERFFRSGRTGGWRDELAPELAERVAHDHAAVMARLGYDTA